MIFWILIVLFWLIFSILLKKSKFFQQWYSPFLTGLILFTLIILIATLDSTFTCISNNEEIQRLEDDIKVLDEKYDKQKSFIMSSLEKYPLEENLLKAFNPTILLKLPEIKSDIFLMKNIENVLAIQDHIYAKKISKNAVQKELRIYRNYRLYYPTLVKPIKEN